MSHVRSTLLAAAKTALSANTAIARVYLQRVPPSRQLWPAVCVYADTETVESLGMAYPRQQLREMVMVCKGYVRTTQDEEADEVALNTLAVEIEDTLKASSLTGEKNMALTATDWGIEDVGDLAMLTISLTYLVRYTTTEYLPETAT